MDTLQWRGNARIVAYVDLVLTSGGLLGAILLTIGVGFLTTQDSPDAQAIKALGTAGVWIFVAIVAIIAFIQLYAAIKLLQGTDHVREYGDAWRNCATWRNITVVFLVFQIVVWLLLSAFASVVICVLIRGTFLYIVHKFMAELDQRRSPLEVPNMVTIMKN